MCKSNNLALISISALSFLGFKFIDFTVLNPVIALILEIFLLFSFTLPLVRLFCYMYNLH